jgi:hypothetical protein
MTGATEPDVHLAEGLVENRGPVRAGDRLHIERVEYGGGGRPQLAGNGALPQRRQRVAAAAHDPITDLQRGQERLGELGGRTRREQPASCRPSPRPAMPAARPPRPRHLTRSQRR